MLLALLACLVGYAGIYFYAWYEGKNLNEDTNYKIVSQLDNLFTSLQTTAQTLSPLANSIDCSDILTIFSKVVKAAPAIESINILKNDKLYCSSQDKKNYQMFIKQFNLDSSSKEPIIIFDDTFTFYIQNTPQATILITVDNNVIMSILKPKLPTQLITLELDNRVFSFYGLIPKPDNIHNAVEEISNNKFSYKLTTGFYQPPNLKTLLTYYGVGFVITALIAIIVYIITRWMIEKTAGAYFELDRAIRNNEIRAYVQPIYGAKLRTVIGVEILARWHHPIEGIILPDAFIPIAEQTGLIINMTKQLLKQVGTTFAPYTHRINQRFKFGFNISRLHCQDLDLIDDCKNFYNYLGVTDTSIISLVIEITEKELIEVTDITKQLLQELHKLNAQIALDDFGIGNSNLSYLYDFSIDYLKIDKSFVSRFGSDALSKNILDSIIEIALNCQLESCAEGVESELQANYLSDKGVNYLQGYYFSKPIPLQEFIDSPDFQKILGF